MKILKFYTETCMPCKAMGKLLEKVDVEVESINALEDIEKVDIYNVCTTPTLVFLDDDGNEYDRTTGPVPLSKIQEIINKKK